MSYRGKLEYAHKRSMRTRNTRLYRLAHWPLWIWVFFLAPGPLTFSLVAHGFGRGSLAWLALVLVGTGIAAIRGSIPGAEPAPYILRFDEDKPNPLYRRVCYTFAWNAVLSFALLNLGWLVLVLVGTGIAAFRGSIPGAEPAPYILRFDEDKPNPLYRRVCYTFAWNAVLSFA